MSRIVVLIMAALAGAAVAQAQQPDAQPKPAGPQKTAASPEPAGPQPGAQTPSASDLLGFPNEQERNSYAFGYDFGKTVQARRIEILLDQVITGLKDAYSGKPGRLSDKDATVWARAVFNEGIRRLQAEKEAIAAKNRADGQAFLDTNGKRPGVVTLPSGLQYEVLRAGNGPKPAPSDAIKVHFKGMLVDGTVFDSSEGRDAPVLTAGEGFPGWNEALPMMPVGSKWKLFIPADLGWGDKIEAANIPPGATLIFEVDLLSIEPQTATPPASK